MKSAEIRKERKAQREEEETLSVRSKNFRTPNGLGPKIRWMGDLRDWKETGLEKREAQLAGRLVIRTKG